MAVESFVPKEQVGFLSAQCDLIIHEILASLGADARVDRDVVWDLTHFFLRDIFRIDRQQRGSVSIAKLAGYWAFWIRKLKPISDVQVQEGSELSTKDLTHINEIVCIQFALEIVMMHRDQSSLQDHVKAECELAKNGECNGADCFVEFSEKYLNFKDEFYLDYIIYSMRNRTFGPHHFALLIENMIFAACKGVRD